MAKMETSGYYGYDILHKSCKKKMQINTYIANDL